MSSYDPGVDKLNVFSTLLESTNRILEDAASKLDALGQELSEHETELRGALVALTSEVEAVEKDVEAWETGAVAAAKEVAADAHQAAEARLPAIETGLDLARQRVDGALTSHGAALQSQLDELETQGFNGLDAVLQQEDADFERWTNEANAALSEMSRALDAEGEETKRDIQDAATGLDAAKDQATDQHTAASGTLDQQLDQFDQSLQQEVDKRCTDAGTNIPNWIDTQWTNAIQTLVTTYHNMLASVGKDESDAIQQEENLVVTMVEKTETALTDADSEFERCAVGAEWSEREVSVVTSLRPGIEQADQEVAEIRALLEAVGS